MFLVISVIGFLGTFLVIIYSYRDVGPKPGKNVGVRVWLSNQRKAMLSPLGNFKTNLTEDVTKDLRRPVYSLTILSFILLALTGFIPRLFFGNPVSGFVLILHFIAAPVFAVGLTINCILRAHRHRFDKNDWQSLRRFFRQKTAPKKSNPPKTEFGKKICFWLLLLLSLAVMVSVILSMFPLFGVTGLESLLHLHGYSALLLVITAVAGFFLLKLPRSAGAGKQ